MYLKGGSIMECRTHERREWIVAHYNVKPLIHVRLVDGTVFQGDAGRELSYSCVIFCCEDKAKKEQTLIKCGRKAAAYFCKLLNIKMPRIFNPLKEDLRTANTKGKKSGNDCEKWEPSKRKLADVLYLFLYRYKIEDSNHTAFKILSHLEKNKHRYPKVSEMKMVNTLLKGYNTTARDLVEYLEMNNKIREFDFHIFAETLERYDIEQYFEK